MRIRKKPDALWRHTEEQYLRRLQRKILASARWRDFERRACDGKKKVMRAIEEQLEINYIAEVYGTAPLATAMRDGIVFNQAYYPALSNPLKRKILTHEMIHAYMGRQQFQGWCDRDDEFITYAHFLQCDGDIRVTVQYKTLGETQWRE